MAVSRLTRQNRLSVKVPLAASAVWMAMPPQYRRRLQWFVWRNPRLPSEHERRCAPQD
jgi:hypothetical protein